MKKKLNIGVLVLVLLSIFVLSGCTKGSNMTKEEIKTTVTEFLTLSGAQNFTITEVTEEQDLYKVVVVLGGSTYDSYVTKDGKKFFQQAMEINIEDLKKQKEEKEQKQQKAFDKKDRPSSELYIFSYCPAGTSALDAYAEVGKKFNGSSDLKVKFFSDMHGAHERQQNMVQSCIQKLEGAKYWNYAGDFSETVYSKCGTLPEEDKRIACDKTESENLMRKHGINSNAVFECVKNEGEAIYAQEINDANTLSLQYSPSFVLNGVWLEDADRTPQGMQNVLCSTYNQMPDQCNAQISSESAPVNGNC